MQSSPVRRENTAPEGISPDQDSARPIDLVHLAQQSLGDKELEIELLSLFERQGETIMARISQPVSCGDRRWQHDLAHTLKGSARAVGAARVAQAAQAFEDILVSNPTEALIADGVERLNAAVDEARSIIHDLIANA